jgi:hypothetical protein
VTAPAWRVLIHRIGHVVAPITRFLEAEFFLVFAVVEENAGSGSVAINQQDGAAARPLDRLGHR